MTQYSLSFSKLLTRLNNIDQNAINNYCLIATKVPIAN